MQNEELMGIRREEEMEMSDDDMEDTHDPDDSGTHTLHTYHTHAHTYPRHSDTCSAINGPTTDT